MALEQLEILKQAIFDYTGLSTTAFLTVLALTIAVYYAVSGLFGSPDRHVRHGEINDHLEPLLPPVQLGEVTEDELRAYDGSDLKKPLLMAIKGHIYDVSKSRMFYGPGGPYALFAGKDASRALAKMSFDDADLNGDISGLSSSELETLEDWEYKFKEKYTTVGTIRKSSSETEVPNANVAAAENGSCDEKEVPIKDVADENCDDNNHCDELGKEDHLHVAGNEKSCEVE